MIELQSNTTTIFEVRTLFDGVFEKYSQFCDQLGSTASIAEIADFEVPSFKVLRKQDSALTKTDKRSITQIRKDTIGCSFKEHQEQFSTEAPSFGKRLLKSASINTSIVSSKSTYLKFISSTSNICKRIFSPVDYVANDRKSHDRRTQTLTRTRKMQLFFYVNSSFWEVEDVADIANWTVCLERGTLAQKQSQLCTISTLSKQVCFWRNFSDREEINF